MTATLIPDARAFLGQLAANNTKDWWEANKPTYDARLKTPALGLLDDLRPRLSRLTGTDIATKLFRPHRDVRFSKDKTPYHTHLHMFWALDTKARQNPVFYFGIGLDYVSAGVGLMGFDKGVLEDWRRMVDRDRDRVSGLLDGLQAQGFRLREPDLKRVPAPYDQDHPAGHLLRLKGLTMSGTLEATGPLDEALMARFTTLWPVNQLLLQVAKG